MYHIYIVNPGTVESTTTTCLYHLQPTSIIKGQTLDIFIHPVAHHVLIQTHSAWVTGHACGDQQNMEAQGP